MVAPPPLVVPHSNVLVQRAGLVRAAGRGAAVASAATLAATVAFTAASMAVPAVAFGIVHVLSLIVSVVLLAARHRPPSEQRGLPARITVAEADLEIATHQRTWRFAKEELEGGWVEWHGAWPFVVLQLRDRSLVYIQTRAHSEANALLVAAGARQRAVTMRARSRRIDSPRAVGCAAVAAAYMCVPLLIGMFVVEAKRHENPVVGLAFGFVVCLVAAIVLFTRFPSTNVVVGTDGIELKRPLSRRQFVAYSELGGVTLEGPTLRPYVRFHRSSGAPIDVRVSSYLEGETLCSRIREAMGGAGSRASFDLATLDRGARNLADWRDGLSKLLARSTGYRQRVVEALDLAQAAESGALPPARRVAAALALHSAGDETLRQRVRIAAEGCANPRVRNALVAAADGQIHDDATLEELSREEQSQAWQGSPGARQRR